MSPAVQIMINLGLKPDPWQAEVLEGAHRRLLLNCCRQAGKSTVVAILALVEALFKNDSQILLLSPSYRQSRELFHTMLRFYDRLEAPMKVSRSTERLELSNGSRIIALPCKEETIRGYANVSLLVIDEAARVYDDLYHAVRPMLAVSQGRLIVMSTPYGQQGFFHDCWARGGEDWKRIEIPAAKVPRITAKYLEEERRSMDEAWFRQEFCCSFEAKEGMVYPDLARCVAATVPAGCVPAGKRVGGIDFGYNSPFAAIWGVLDSSDILWLTDEHFCRGQPLSHHASIIPKNVYWYCDPAGANERAELRRADFKVVKGINAIRPGIAAVSARIQSRRLRILAGKCPNLLVEAGLYRYDPSLPGNETPVDEYNHAMDALRYLVCSLDAHRKATPAAKLPVDGAPLSKEPPPKPQPKIKPWLRLDNEELWTTL